MRVPTWVMMTLASLTLSACATGGPVAEAPATDGIAHVFPAPYEIIKAAAQQSVGQIGVSYQGANETAERYQLQFMSATGAFGGAAPGVVNVMRVDDRSTRVVVNTADSAVLSVSTISERQLAD
jgi:hypothetical protein